MVDFRTVVCALVAACSFSSLHAAKSVISDFVKILGPGEVFSPIPEATGKTDAARLVDAPVVFTAEYAKDFEVDGDLDKAVWKNVPAYTNFVTRRKDEKFPFKTELQLNPSADAAQVPYKEPCPNIST